MAQAIHDAQLLDVPFRLASKGDGLVFRGATLADGVIDLDKDAFGRSTRRIQV